MCIDDRLCFLIGLIEFGENWFYTVVFLDYEDAALNFNDFLFLEDVIVSFRFEEFITEVAFLGLQFCFERSL